MHLCRPRKSTSNLNETCISRVLPVPAPSHGEAALTSGDPKSFHKPSLTSRWGRTAHFGSWPIDLTKQVPEMDIDWLYFCYVFSWDKLRVWGHLGPICGPITGTTSICAGSRSVLIWQTTQLEPRWETISVFMTDKHCWREKYIAFVTNKSFYNTDMLKVSRDDNLDTICFMKLDWRIGQEWFGFSSTEWSWPHLRSPLLTSTWRCGIHGSRCIVGNIDV